MKMMMINLPGICMVPYTPMSPEVLPASDAKALLESAVGHKQTAD